MHKINLVLPTIDIPTKSYLLDSKNCFTWFSPEWDQEFQSISPKEFSTRDYLGQNFFDLLANPDIKLLYESLFLAARRRKNSIFSISLRCDTPSSKAILDLNLVKQDHNGLKASFAYTQLETYTKMGPLLVRKEEELLKMCSWCQDIFDFTKDRWLPIEQALVDLSLLHKQTTAGFTHSCCPRCISIIRGKTHAYTGG